MLSTVSFANQATLLSKGVDGHTCQPSRRQTQGTENVFKWKSVYVGVVVFGENALNKWFASLCQIAIKTDQTNSHFF